MITSFFSYIVRVVVWLVSVAKDRIYLQPAFIKSLNMA